MRTDRRSLLAALAALGAALWTRPVAARQQTETSSAGPLTWFSGPESEIREQRIELIRDAETWKKRWGEHVGIPADEMAWRAGPQLEFDFEQGVVLAVFQGKGQNTRRYDLISVEQTEEGTLLRIDASQYQSSGGVTPTSAFAFAFLPVSDGKLTVEENTQGIIGRPPKWTKVAEF